MDSGLARSRSWRRALLTGIAVLAAALGFSWPSRADASMTWYLLVPPATYDPRSHLYASVPDAPLPRWYRDGEYGSERACVEARAAKGGEAERLSRKTTDEDNFHAAQAWALHHGRCVSVVRDAGSGR
jgi:hypothetical protein